jgi:nucleoside-diphosphate-sugar epimerase
MTARRSVLVTGATGVLGSAVVEALSGHDVVALAHAGSEVGGADALPGSVEQPQLGLAPRVYQELCARVDCVVHCAATSHYAVREADVRAVNVGGTERVLAFCEQAGAHLYHVGTALAPPRGQAGASPRNARDREPAPLLPPEPARRSPFSREPYLESKRDAEHIVRSSRMATTVVRPSLVIGDLRTGATPRFQGIHTLMRFILTETYGVVPAIATDRADYLPRDTMAGAIACMIDAGETPELCWLTAGDRAPTMQRVVDLALAYGRSVGLDPTPARFMDPEVIDRLVRPALLPELPHRERQRFEYVIEFASGLHSGRIFPTALDDFAGRMTIPTASDLEDALTNSLRYWGAETNLAAERAAS